MKGQQASWLIRLTQQKPQSLSTIIHGRRSVHAAFSASEPAQIQDHDGNQTETVRRKPRTPLSLLPLPTLLRSYAITALSSFPVLLTPSLRLLSMFAHSSSPFLNPDRNPLLHFLLKRTFYAQFCAGETTAEVQYTTRGLKNLGFKGIILAYGKEIVLSQEDKIAATKPWAEKDETAAERAAEDVQAWKEGTMQTVEMTEPGDFVALKFSGAGRDVMRQLVANLPRSDVIEKATTEICELARKRGVRLLFDAEQSAVQDGIDAWTLDYQKRYNKDKAVVYGTYQAYLRSTPATVARHLIAAEKGGFVLGVKLVRGAYMASDPRHLFWATKSETDEAYDGIAEGLMKRQWNTWLRPADFRNAFPEVGLVLASHNEMSVKKAMAMRKEQTMNRQPKTDMAYGQLMGMADEVSCDLVLARKQNEVMNSSARREVDSPNAYKYLVWGSVGECLKYLVRRAEENRDAVLRASRSRKALKSEILRRLWLSS